MAWCLPALAPGCGPRARSRLRRTQGRSALPSIDGPFRETAVECHSRIGPVHPRSASSCPNLLLTATTRPGVRHRRAQTRGTHALSPLPPTPPLPPPPPPSSPPPPIPPPPT